MNHDKRMRHVLKRERFPRLVAVACFCRLFKRRKRLFKGLDWKLHVYNQATQLTLTFHSAWFLRDGERKLLCETSCSVPETTSKKNDALKSGCRFAIRNYFTERVCGKGRRPI